MAKAEDGFCVDSSQMVDATPLTVDDPRVVESIETYAAALEQGKIPDRRELLDQYPRIAEELAACLNALEFVHEAAPQVTDPATGAGVARPDSTGIRSLGSLGDFRIVREAGRGGMGVVYEAEQISMGRRVALKVLPFAGVLDPKHLLRFKNEARAAGSLDHPSIVHAYSVGCERAVHFYAMQYVEGQTLAQVIDEMQRVAGAERRVAEGEPRVAGAERSGAPDSDSQQMSGAALPDPSHASAETHRQPQAAISTERSTRSTEFFHSVADLGIQAADALEHAHAMGIVHRDVKPSNLMVDAAGHLWITDFGLAMTHTDTNLTLTGDLLGTLRYMSPEQVEAKHGVLDHRTDVYSLGVTLYELLTLRPAFPGGQRQKLMRQIIEEDPRPPRQLNDAIPKDLETIVLKATTKEPQARYATAGELADDLRRFLDDKPIRARRPSLLERAAKWSRRHRTLVGSATVLLAMATAALTISTVLIARHSRRAENNFRLAMKAMDEIYFEFAEQMCLELPDDPLGQPNPITPEGQRYLEKATAFYEQFAQQNRGQPAVRLETAKAYTRVGNIRGKLGMYTEAESAFDRAVEIAGRLFSQLPHLPEHRKLIADAYQGRGLAAFRKGNVEGALADYDEALRIDPQHLDALLSRGIAYWHSHDVDKALADCTKAIQLDPEHPGGYLHRGNTYVVNWEHEEAIVDYTKAIRLRPQHADAYFSRANAYRRMGDLDNAIADCDQAIRLDPKHRITYFLRARVYATKGDSDEALRDYTEAIRLQPRDYEAYSRRAGLYREKGDRSNAIADATQATELEPEDGGSWSLLGRLLWEDGRPEEAVDAYRKAIEACRKGVELQPHKYYGYGEKSHLAYLLVAVPFPELWRPAEAVELAREAHELNPKGSTAPRALGIAHYRIGGEEHWKEAISALEKSVEIRRTLPGKRQDYAFDWFFMAMAHWQLGDEKEACKKYHEAVDWMDHNKPDDEELRRFRSEAAELLGISEGLEPKADSPPPDEKEMPGKEDITENTEDTEKSG